MRLRILLVVAGLCTSGCASASSAVGEGTLEPLSAPNFVGEEHVLVGELVVDPPGAGFWDHPGGVTIGRLPPGTYPVLDSQEGWHQLQAAIGDETVCGWVPTAGTHFHPPK